jgi:predicted Zn-dependent peptidase
MAALDVIADLLSNNASAGSIDQLVNDGKILMGGLEYMPYNDGGTAFLYFVPKIPFQSLHKAESLVMGCLNDIKAGKFTDDALAAVKTNRVKSFELSLESNNAGAGNLINAYVKGVSTEEYFNYPQKIKALTREDIVRVAGKYFGENSLTMYSRSGKVKKDKLAKPPFKPVVSKNETHSTYYNEWKKIPEQPLQPHYVNPEKDIDSVNLALNVDLLRNQNPVNKVASMQLVFGTGRHYIPLLAYVDDYMELCGTKTHEINEFNRQLYTLGCTYSIDPGAHQFVIKMSFPEENLEKVLALFKELLTQPRIEKKTVRKIVRQLFVERLVNKRSPDYYADALESYVIYGDKSPYLDKMGRKEFKHISLGELEGAFTRVWNASLKVIYTGTLSSEKISVALREKGFVFDHTNPQPLYMTPKADIHTNTVYLVNMRKARQSQVSLVKTGDPYTLEKTPVINAFNKYFGGDMSSLVFQEVREFRSLAYSTSAMYGMPALPGYKGSFVVSAGTQNDKTNECIEVMYDLVNHMPQHPNRMESIRSSLIQMNAAARPSFRNMINWVENWKRKGYPIDPLQYNGARYPQLTFTDIENLYTRELQNKATAVCVTGKLKAFDTKALKKYGTVKKIKKKKLVKR